MLPGTVSPALHCRRLTRTLLLFTTVFSLSETLEKSCFDLILLIIYLETSEHGLESNGDGFWQAGLAGLEACHVLVPLRIVCSRVVINLHKSKISSFQSLHMKCNP